MKNARARQAREPAEATGSRPPDADRARVEGPVRVLQQQAGNDAVAGLLAPAVVTEVVDGEGGRPLDEDVREEMESRLGVGLAAVRVHDGPRADESARAIGAAAYTVGNDIVFAEGLYRPGTGAGDALIAHELAHVIQQAGRSEGPLRLGPAEGTAEVEARGVAGGTGGVRRGAAVGATVQRAPADAAKTAPAVPSLDRQAFKQRFRAAIEHWQLFEREPAGHGAPWQTGDEVVAALRKTVIVGAHPGYAKRHFLELMEGAQRRVTPEESTLMDETMAEWARDVRADAFKAVTADPERGLELWQHVIASGVVDLPELVDFKDRVEQALLKGSEEPPAAAKGKAKPKPAAGAAGADVVRQAVGDVRRDLLDAVQIGVSRWHVPDPPSSDFVSWASGASTIASGTGSVLTALEGVGVAAEGVAVGLGWTGIGLIVAGVIAGVLALVEANKEADDAKARANLETGIKDKLLQAWSAVSDHIESHEDWLTAQILRNARKGGPDAAAPHGQWMRYILAQLSPGFPFGTSAGSEYVLSIMNAKLNAALVGGGPR